MKAVVSMRVQYMLHHWGKNTYSSWLLGTGMCIILYSTLYAFIMLGWLYSCLQGVYILQTLQGVEKSLMPYSQVFMFFYRFDFPLGELLSHSTLRFSTSWLGARVATFILALHKINTAVAYHYFVWFEWIFAVCYCIAISRRLYCLKRFSLLDWRRCITLYMKTSPSTSTMHESLMELIARVSDSQKKKEDLPGNANLRSQRIKSELIQALGKQIFAIWR